MATLGEVKKAVRDVLAESVSRHCYIYLATDGNWYMELSDREYDDGDDANVYGPFRSEEAAVEHLDNFSNPGGWDTDDRGTMSPPTKGSNGRPLINPSEHGFRPHTSFSFGGRYR